jgi:type I restriction enzyme S subunit
VADRRLVLGRGLAGIRHRSGRQSFLLHQLAHIFAEEDAVGDGTMYKAVTKQFLSIDNASALPGRRSSSDLRDNRSAA